MGKHLSDKCQCRVCRDLARWKNALVVNEASAQAFDEIMTQLEGATTDNNVSEAVFDGTWPSAEERLKYGLENVYIKKAQDGQSEDLIKTILEFVKSYNIDKVEELIRRSRIKGLNLYEFETIEKSIHSSSVI